MLGHVFILVCTKHSSISLKISVEQDYAMFKSSGMK